MARSSKDSRAAHEAAHEAEADTERVHFHNAYNNMGHDSAYGPIDVHGGPMERMVHSPDEVDPDELQEIIASQRALDAEGKDSAYANGFTKNKKPAPAGGWPIGTELTELMDYVPASYE